LSLVTTDSNGNTPLSPEEIQGLIPSLSTKQELNEWEWENISPVRLSFGAYGIFLILALPEEPREPDIRLLTYLRAFFGDWLTGMSGPLSVPFAALAVWSQQREQKII